jgi:stress response protein SCP2
VNAVVPAKGQNIELDSGIGKVELKIMTSTEANIDVILIVTSRDTLEPVQTQMLFRGQTGTDKESVAFLGESIHSGRKAERIHVDLQAMAHRIQSIAVVVTSGIQQLARLGDIELTLRANASDIALCVLRGMTDERAAIIAEIYQRHDRWRVRMVGQGWSDGLTGLANDIGLASDIALQRSPQCDAGMTDSNPDLDHDEPTETQVDENDSARRHQGNTDPDNGRRQSSGGWYPRASEPAIQNDLGRAVVESRVMTAHIAALPIVDRTGPNFTPASRPTNFDPSPYAKAHDRTYLELGTDGQPSVRLEWWRNELWFVDRNDLILPCDRPGLRSIGIFGFDVRGLRYHKTEAFQGNFVPGGHVELVLEPGNPHDSSAVGVRAAGSREIVGYVNKGLSKRMSKLLKSEFDLQFLCIRGAGPGKLAKKISVVVSDTALMVHLMRNLHS